LPPYRHPLKLYYLTKLALSLLSKLLLPDSLFSLFHTLLPGQLSQQAFAKFFSSCSFKQRHYLMTQALMVCM
jgi:hypothetical protein